MPHRLAAPLARLLAGCLCLLLIRPPLAADRAVVLTPGARRALETLPAGQMLSVIVRLAGEVDPTSGQADWVTRLREHAAISQAAIREWLRLREADGRVRQVDSFWIFNGLAVTASRDVILELAGRPDVVRIALDEIFLAPARAGLGVDSAPVAENLVLIGAPQAWARGFTGKGIVVALLDSGVDILHPELAARWRGGSNSWFDPYGQHIDEPFDSSGHGTQTLGVILGGDASGTRIGVAPDAQWIAAKVFNDRDRATASAIHKALQWVLDPDGDPATPDAPHVVNNSWSFTNVGCDFEFAEDLRALRAAGILPVFAAGVRGPVSPANTPEAFAVGALAEATTPLDDSARGPSRCGDVSAIYPHVVAPGAKILTTDRFGLYAALDGTSLAAAHVSGALALLLDATPNLSPDEQADLLTGTAVDLGEPGPDNTFGYGRIDIAAALDRLQGLAPPTRAPTVGTASPPPAPAEPASPAPAELPASGAGVALIVVAILALAAFVAARRGAAKG